MSKLALSMKFACLFVMVAVVRGDEPAAVTGESTSGDAPSSATAPADPALSQPLAGPVDAGGLGGGLGGGGFGYGFGFGGAGLGGAGSVAMGLPASAIPGRKWVAGAKVIVAFSDDGQQVFAYSEQQPRWASQELKPVSGAVAVPVVGDDSLAVRHGNYCYAYSTTLGTWDVLKLPPGEVAIPAVSEEGIGVHSASQGDFVFKNSWGKWFSADEIKAGGVAEHLRAQRSAAAASQPDDKTAQEFVVFYLKNVEAAEAARIVRQFFGGKVNPAVETRTNSLIVASDDPLTVNRVRELLQAIELPAANKFALPQPAQSVDDLRQLYNELEQRTRELAARLRDPLPNPATGDRLNDELRDTVKQAFEARQKLQRAELAEFSQRLRGIQQSIEMRDRISQQIIDRRVQELLDPNLKWNAAAIVGDNQAPPVRDDDHVTPGNLPQSNPPAGQPSSHHAAGKPLNSVVRIAFDKHQLGKIDWLAGPGSLTVDGFGKGHIVTPIGSTTSLRLTDLPGRDNAAMFVSLQIVALPSNEDSHKGSLNPAELLAHNAIPLQITDEDRDRVLSGEFVTKWIYLPHDLSTADESLFSTMDSSPSEPGSTQIDEVEKLGVVVAILRLSSRPVPPEVVPPTSRPHDVSPRISIQTLPDEFVCWELFGAKFRKVVDELAEYPFHPAGLQIVELRPSGPAQNAGLRAGDIVVIIDIRSVGEISHVKSALQAWQDSGGERARQVTFVRGKETRRAFVDWLETPTTSPPVPEKPPFEADAQRRLDYELDLTLEVRKTLVQELEELESANPDTADDGEHEDQTAEAVAKARKRAQVIDAVKSKLEEVEDRLRVLTTQRAISQKPNAVPPDNMTDSEQSQIQKATELRNTIAKLVADVAAGEAIIKQNPRHDDIGGITRRLETLRRNLQVHRDELAVRIRLLELHLIEVQSATELAGRNLDRMKQANKAVPSTFSEDTFDKANREYEAAVLRVQRVSALLDLYRKIDPPNERNGETSR